ncbi:hypothetical protein MIND_00938700 [Mycena indigotica]|uniref:Integrase catalytic domain-containing protein n=1 Tax=Mycena indigotica TaxID=2126181 RepID=A0A8H6VWW6_9AGAR|nr:uncharacterized protein MIND_00938700 [Mycena indigotica]KAF7297059.1 hypothetical protein MIND_00938700 [Mycena indigotica]
MDAYRRDNIRAAYSALQERVLITLHTQSADGAELGRHRNDCLDLLRAAQLHRTIFSNEELGCLNQNLHDMLRDLEQAGLGHPDESERQRIQVVQLGMSTPSGGRPPVIIDEDFLKQAIQLRGPTQIARLLGCSPRTVRRRILEFNLANRAPPVFELYLTPDGSSEVRRNADSGQSSRYSQISTTALDAMLASRGMRISRSRLHASLLRVRGAPPAFGQRRIARKKYWVPAVNSLWHHDGQHGLIRWKLVTHAFIDGKSRFVTGLRVHNNNRSYTVLRLFLEAVAQYGAPSRVRGDHGVENVKVAEAMEQFRGSGRGSYIFGRSVHNTRIERLWLDWTQGLGLKWYDFFMDLEQHYGLDVDEDLHMWLLHHLFLDAINAEATEWVKTWNFHIMQIRGEPNRSPADMFLFGLVEEGVRGLGIDMPDLASYGVDHEAQRDLGIMNHFFDHNPQERSELIPDRLNAVVCESPQCPLPSHLASGLRQQLEMVRLEALNTPNMDVRKRLWEVGLRAVITIVNSN